MLRLIDYSKLPVGVNPCDRLATSKMSVPKRKLDQENQFKGKPMCLVCLETKSSMKDFNISRHYNTTAARATIVADLKEKIHRQQSLFTKTTAAQESALKASYVVILELAKAKKPLSDGEMVKWCAIEMAKSFGDDSMAKNFETVSLSHHTKLKDIMNDCKYFSLMLDESTDVTDVSQLLIFTRTIDIYNFGNEELLKLVSLHDTTKGTDIFNAVKMVVNERIGFAGLLPQNGVDCPVLHCIIHQVGGNRALNHRNFIAFLKEVNAAYQDSQIHTDIRWMSCGKCLERFFVLRTELPVFLEERLRCDMSAYCRKLWDTAFLCDMAFLTDITSHLNHLNIQLQGRCQTVPDLYAHMNAFRHKLELFRDSFSSVSPNLTHFHSCEEMRRHVPACEKIFPKYGANIETLLHLFNDRFQDFQVLQPRAALFTAPLSAKVSEQPTELQLELCELQSDPVFQSQRNDKGISFWRLLPDMFGSTYICESSFSTMKHNKSKKRNRLTDETLFQLMQIGSTKIDIDIQNIVQQHARPQVSH
uniref:HAT C-terminal dimerisation domain-containing protein n=1 Tax=Amphiprion percula TaxID=161767 RepID=A0A3P8RML6_AMPPE